MKINFLLIIILIIVGCSNNKPHGELEINKISLTERNPDVEWISSDTYEIESFGENIELGESTNGNNNVESYNVMIFNEFGNLTTGIVKYGTGKYFFKDEFIYDFENNLIQKQRFFEEGVTHKIVWKYNYSDSVIEILGRKTPVFGFGSDYAYNKFTLNLNDKGQTVTESEFGNTNSPQQDYNLSSSNKSTFEYDEIGKLTKVSFFIGSNNTKTELYKYNDNNLISEIELLGSNPKKIKFTYKYDDKGNWVEKIDYIKNEPIFITKRKLKYKK